MKQSCTHTAIPLANQYNADPITPKSQLYALPFTGTTRPNQIKQVFLNTFADLSGRQIQGITSPSNNTNLPANVTLNGNYSTLATDQLACVTISFYDIRKKCYSFNDLPLATLVNGSSFKNPYYLVDLVPDMHQSFIRFNDVTNFVALNTYVLLLNFMYL